MMVYSKGSVIADIEFIQIDLSNKPIDTIVNEIQSEVNRTIAAQTEPATSALFVERDTAKVVAGMFREGVSFDIFPLSHKNITVCNLVCICSSACKYPFVP
jgi:hypothetical protein